MSDPRNDVRPNVIDAGALAQLLDSGAQVRLVDCRFNLADVTAGRRAYDAGHLPGAVFADLEGDLSGPIVKGETGRHPLPDASALADRFAAWGISERTLVVAYDDGSCMYAPHLWWLARWLGHDDVVVLTGGVAAWVNAGRTLTTELPNLSRSSFVARPNASLLAAVSEVEAVASGADKSSLLVDARAEARYRGEQEPIDPVAGHIPTAKNLPFTSLLEAGAPRAAAHVSSAIDTVTKGTPAPRVIAYCGSGVTACALIWAAESSGVKGIRLYPGSWSEWITEPSHGVSRGSE